MLIELSDFTRLFAEKNGLDIARWRFEPGMRHGDRQVWWGLKAPRKHVHYGVDFAGYEAKDGTMRQLKSGMRIPLPRKGRIAGTMKDFLGHTVVVDHGEHNGRLIIGLYGHVGPAEGITGSTLKAGCVIAQLVHPGKGQVPPHLHLGLALLPIRTDFERLSWNYLNTATDVEHIDPLELL